MDYTLEHLSNNQYQYHLYHLPKLLELSGYCRQSQNIAGNLKTLLEISAQYPKISKVSLKKNFPTLFLAKKNHFSTLPQFSPKNYQKLDYKG